MKYVDIIVSILSGLAVCIPLVAKLTQYVQKIAKEKNWAAVMNLVTQYMEQAEKLYVGGATKKEWVMEMVEQSAKNIEYNFDDSARADISNMIDRLCGMAKVVNK